MDDSEKLRVHSKHLEKRNEEIQQELEEVFHCKILTSTAVNVSSSEVWFVLETEIGP